VFRPLLARSPERRAQPVLCVNGLIAREHCASDIVDHAPSLANPRRKAHSCHASVTCAR